MRCRVNDILYMGRPHPCGSVRYVVLRGWPDYRIRCLRCGHEFDISSVHLSMIVRRIEGSKKSST